MGTEAKAAASSMMTPPNRGQSALDMLRTPGGKTSSSPQKMRQYTSRRKRGRILVEAAQSGVTLEPAKDADPMKKQRVKLDDSIKIGGTTFNFRQRPITITPADPTSFFLSKPSQEKEFEALKRVNGIENLGNTCYLAAVTSAVLTLGGLTDGLLNIVTMFPEEIRKSQLPFLSAIAEIIESDRKATSTSLNPVKLRKAMASFCDTFSSYLPQDAHEFFVHLQMGLLQDLEKAMVILEMTGSLSVGDIPPQSIILDAFHLEVCHTITCNDCSYKRDNIEESKCISLDLHYYDEKLGRAFSEAPTMIERFAFGASKGEMSVAQLLKEYLRSKTVKLHCEKCGGGSATVESSFLRVPKILAIHLKRFTPNFKKNRIEKSNARVRIESTLNIVDYLSQRATQTATTTRLRKTSASEGHNDDAFISKRSKTVTQRPQDPPIEKDVSLMTEEEQIAYAIRMSVKDDRLAEEQVEAVAAGIDDDNDSMQQSKLEACVVGDKSPSVAPRVFYLTGVVRHIGARVNDGHFVADVLRTTSTRTNSSSPMHRERQANVVDRQWITVNDTHTSKGENPCGSDSEASRQGYLLFYACDGFPIA